MSLNSIPEALEDIKAGKVVIVVDDEDRENEGDFIGAAEKVTPEMINFMATHGRGLICASLLEERCDELGLEMMVNQNTAAYETPFTVSVDLIGHGTTTGISASDRSKTIQALVNPETKPEELGKPGHIFPLRAKKGGVLRRPGHTEATVDLARLAGLSPGGVLVEIMNEDGTMARLPELMETAKRFDLKVISIADLIAYRMETESLIEKELEFDFTTKMGTFTLSAYKQVTTEEEHIAITFGSWDADEAIPVRVQSANLLTHIYESFRDPEKHFLHEVTKSIAAEGKGVFLFMHQTNHHEDLISYLKDIQGNLDGEETQSGQLYRKMDVQDYGIGAQILYDLGVRKMKLISNDPKRRTGLIGYGLEIVDNLHV
jgi:3,4-dihydroxy 2-butanone 4-phosphate synthase/GTP cyclohydrolase II